MITIGADNIIRDYIKLLSICFYHCCYDGYFKTDPQVAKLNSTGIEEMIQLNASSNHLLYGLKSGQDYDLTIRINDEKCINRFLGSESVPYRFNATSKHVSLYLFGENRVVLEKLLEFLRIFKNNNQL